MTSEVRTAVAPPSAAGEDRRSDVPDATAGAGADAGDPGGGRSHGAQRLEDGRTPAPSDVPRDEACADPRVASLRQGLRRREARLASLQRDLGERDRRLAALEQELSAVRARLQARERQLAELVQSSSWRHTAPLRRLDELRARPRSLARLAERLPGLRGRRTRARLQRLRASPLFDAEHYLRAHPDVRDAGTDPALHYLEQGWKELRDPSAAFSTAQYLLDHPDVAENGTNPLVHYLETGAAEGRTIAPGSASRRAAAKLARQGNTACLQIRPAAAIDEEVRVIRASGRFDEPYYRAMYVDVPADADPVRHYCEHGWREGKNPSEEFDTRFYLETYSDIRDVGMNPFYHYVLAGRGEQRYASVPHAGRYEDDVEFGPEAADVRVIAFYARPDWRALRGARATFKGYASLSPPHDDLGYYDPCDGEALRRQAALARRHGLYAFCFALETDTVGRLRGPLATVISDPAIDLAFCVRISVPHGAAVDAVARALAQATADPRYVRVADRPLLVVLSAGDATALAGSIERLREALARCGAPRCHVVAQTAPDTLAAGDASLDLPHAPVPGETGDFPPRDRDGLDTVAYGVVASQGLRRARSARTAAGVTHPVVTLARASARVAGRPLVYTAFSLEHYRRWLDAALEAARGVGEPEQRLVFIESWNDWNEGLALEPDRLGGYGRLNETTRALRGLPSGMPTPKVSVIVPRAGEPAALRTRLDSVFAQTHRNVEVILLDDGAAGDSRYVLEEYAALHPEITRLVAVEACDGGRFRRWARGIQAARGDLVWIAESGTDCDERFLEVMVGCFADEGVLLAAARVDHAGRRRNGADDLLAGNALGLDVLTREDEHVATAHHEVREALGIVNTFQSVSAVLFRRPAELPLLRDENWLSMQSAGDWILYLHLARGGKIARTGRTTSVVRRAEGEGQASFEQHCREWTLASCAVASLYDVPTQTLERSRRACLASYSGATEADLAREYDTGAVERARAARLPNVMVSTMGFYPGGAEILPIRLANELKRRGLGVTLFSAGLNAREDGVRRMLRPDIPVVESADPEDLRAAIREFGIECLNSHQWFIQRYPVELPDVFAGLHAHVASLHGMIEHGNAFRVTERELRAADAGVTTWVYTAQKNLAPFIEADLYDPRSPRFLKIPNGMQPPRVVPVPRADLGIPADAFVLCCVSRAIPDKGWAETIAAVERARALTGCDIRLILVGNGPVYDELCRSGAPECVYLAGFNEDSVGHYAASDMGVMLTKFKSESFPLTVVDCLFAGKPYLASDLGDIRNMLTTDEGIAGALVELQDWEIPVEQAAREIATFATERARYREAQARVAAAARRYRIDSVAGEYIRLFEDSRCGEPLRAVALTAEVQEAAT
jgi:hypothetical protein